MSPQTISLREFAAQLGVCYDTAFKMAKAGRIPGAIQPRGVPKSKWRIPASALQIMQAQAQEEN